MLRVLIVLVVIAAALLRGGSLSGFARLSVRHVPLVLGSFLIQLLIFPLIGERPLLADFTVPLYLTSMALLVWWVWLNRHLHGIVLIGAGLMMNLAAIVANGGYMPVDPAAALYAGQVATLPSEIINNNTILSDRNIQLWLLTDIFPVPAGVPFATVYSLGDILLTTGVSLLCYRTILMRPADPGVMKGAPDEHRIPAT